MRVFTLLLGLLILCYIRVSNAEADTSLNSVVPANYMDCADPGNAIKDDCSIALGTMARPRRQAWPRLRNFNFTNISRRPILRNYYNSDRKYPFGLARLFG